MIHKRPAHNPPVPHRSSPDSNHKYDIQDYDYIDPHYGVIVEDGGDILPEGETENRKATKYRQRVADLRILKLDRILIVQLRQRIMSPPSVVTMVILDRRMIIITNSGRSLGRRSRMRILMR